MIEIYDSLITHCPQLGDEIPFRYCRIVNENIPCRRIVACWELRIEISRFLDEHYSLAELQRALSPPAKTKIESILELVEKAKETTNKIG